MKKAVMLQQAPQVFTARTWDRLITDWMGIGVIAAFLIFAFGNLAYFTVNKTYYGLSAMTQIKSPIYGPFVGAKDHIAPYSYNQVGRSFGNFELLRVGEISKPAFRDMLLLAAPKNLQRRMNNYIDLGLQLAQKYQVDPFWVMAIMWTESHFNPDAKSYVKATGLMQIMPGTGHFLSAKMNRPVSPRLAYELIKEPSINIEMGVYYLRYLLKKFSGSYRLATVAYNMGPATVRKRVRLGLPVGVRNLYLDKVRRAYSSLSSEYRRFLVMQTPAFEHTYVVHPRRIQLKKDWDLLKVLDGRAIKFELASFTTEPLPNGKSILL